MLRVEMRDHDVEALGDGVCRLLEQVGMKFQNETMLAALKEWGATVDDSTQIAKFPRRLLDRFVEDVRREYRRSGPDEAAVPFHAPDMPQIETQVAQYLYDYDAGERRPGKSEDYVEFIKLGDRLPGAPDVGHCLLLTDVPPLVEPLEALLLQAEYAHRPQGVFAWNASQAAYLREMGDALGLERAYSFGAVCIAHPLRFDRAVADRYVMMIAEGHRGGLTAMPVAGLSTPITVEGFIVVSTAEQLGAWIAARAMNPKAPLGGSVWCGTPDMKIGHISFSNFDAMYYNVATVQFTRDWCGVEIVPSGPDYANAKRPGLYAVLEKAYKAMIVAAFTGAHPSIGGGMVDTGKVLSDVQLLLERDMTEGLQQFGRSIAATEERIGFPTILEVGTGDGASYFQSDHTALNFRSSLWLPELLDRTGWNGPESEARIMDRYRDKVRALTAEYQKPEGREGKLAAARRVVERARKELLS